MTDFPRSLIEFQQRFGDEAACAQYLAAARWPDGFVCPGCGGGKAWRLETKAWTYECASCRRQTSVTAGTIMHHSKLPLTAWFWAYLMATHSNGISALQLQRQLAFGSYKTAWLICAKLRCSMLAPGRSPLAGLVEVDETQIACRSKNDPVTGGGGRSHQGKMLVVGAVEVEDGGLGPGRIRLSQVADYSAASLHAFLADNVAAGATAKTDGWSGYPGAAGVTHDPHVVGEMAAHIVLPWVHRIFSNLKVWALGVYHGLRRKHLQSYLDEFVFRFNRRRTRHAAFRSLLGIAAAQGAGSVLEEAGASWRVGFFVSAAVCLTPLVTLPARMAAAPAARPDRAFVARAVRSAAVWRLLALFVAANGVPLIVSAWFVAYLTRDAGLGTAVAGALAFVVFGLTTVVRPIGARLGGAGRPFGALGCAPHPPLPAC